MPPTATDVPALAGLLLAAGGASRFGATKVLRSYRGEPLVSRAARLLAAHCPAGVTVVVGADAARVQAAVPAVVPAATVVTNPAWASGLSASLAAGVAVLPPDAGAVLVLLADQPLVDDDDLARLVGAWQADPGRIAAAAFGAVLGVPAVLPRRCFPALAALRGDQGARAVIAADARRIAVPMPHAAVDVDTPDDLARLP